MRRFAKCVLASHHSRAPPPPTLRSCYVAHAHSPLLLCTCRRLFNKELAKSFSSWEEFAQEAAHKLKQMTKFGNRMMRQSEIKAWNNWLDMIEERRRMRSFMMRLTDAGLGKAWNAWTELMYEQDRLRGIMSKAANGPMHKAFNSWLEALEEISRMRAVIGKVVEPGPSKAFNRWVEWTEEGMRLATFGNRMANHGLLKAWNQWAGFGDECYNDWFHFNELARTHFNELLLRTLMANSDAGTSSSRALCEAACAAAQQSG